MQCPKCGNEQESTVECESCGIIFSRYISYQQKLALRESEARSRPDPAELQVTRRNRLSSLAPGLLIGVFLGAMAFYFTTRSPVAPPPKVARTSVPVAEHAVRVSRPEPDRPAPALSPLGPDGVAGRIGERFPARSPLERARNATVTIKTSWGSGTGFFINDSGLIVTNRHVVSFNSDKLEDYQRKRKEMAGVLARGEKGIDYLRRQLGRVRDNELADEIRAEIARRRGMLLEYRRSYEKIGEQIDVISRSTPNSDVRIILVDGTEYRPDSVNLSNDLDLALLTINAYNTPFIKRYSAGMAPQGLKVYTIGNPVGLRQTMTSGIISGYREFKGLPLIQIDAPINPGNSGGPLVDEHGRVLGVNSLVLSGAQGIGFAIPINKVMQEFSIYQ